MPETKRNDAELLRDILESIEKVERYTEGMTFVQFSKDELTIDAVARNFGIIGEAAGRLNKEKIVANFPHVDWRNVTSFRHKIEHDYFDIDVRIVWEIRSNNLPEMKN
jgi:uncharacterized protein with HEPN domain